MLSTVCLLAVLGIYSGLRVLAHVVRVLRLDPWESLVYLGLAEHDAPPAAVERRRVQSA